MSGRKIDTGCRFANDVVIRIMVLFVGDPTLSITQRNGYMSMNSITVHRTSRISRYNTNIAVSHI